MVSRQRLSQLRHPDRKQARKAVYRAVRSGKLTTASNLKCTDCGDAAAQYDHWKGYSKENWLNVQPVCVPCHVDRTMRSPEYWELRFKTMAEHPTSSFRQSSVMRALTTTIR